MSPSHQWYGVIPGWLLFYALIVVALVPFGLRVAYLSRLMLQGKPAARWDNIPARLRAVLVFVFGQLRLLRGDFWPGLCTPRFSGGSSSSPSAPSSSSA